MFNLAFDPRLQEQKLQALRQAINDSSNQLMSSIDNDRPPTGKQVASSTDFLFPNIDNRFVVSVLNRTEIVRLINAFLLLVFSEKQASSLCWNQKVSSSLWKIQSM